MFARIWPVMRKEFLRIVRGIVLKGAGPEQVWQDTLILLGFGVLMTVLSALRMQKRIG